MIEPRALDARARAILALDGGAGLLVGVCVLALSSWLASLYGVARETVLWIGAANVAYGLFSGTMALGAWRGTPPGRGRTRLLIVANVLWATVCVGIIARNWATVSGLGVALIGGEGAFVVALAIAEARWVLPELGTRRSPPR